MELILSVLPVPFQVLPLQLSFCSSFPSRRSPIFSLLSFHYSFSIYTLSLSFYISFSLSLPLCLSLSISFSLSHCLLSPFQLRLPPSLQQVDGMPFYDIAPLLIATKSTAEAGAKLSSITADKITENQLLSLPVSTANIATVDPLVGRDGMNVTDNCTVKVQGPVSMCGLERERRVLACSLLARKIIRRWDKSRTLWSVL